VHRPLPSVLALPAEGDRSDPQAAMADVDHVFITRPHTGGVCEQGVVPTGQNGSGSEKR
jgi:hypothetical protein